MLKLLIVEGNTREARELAVASGNLTQSDLYEKTLLFLRADAECTIAFPADESEVLPTIETLENYDGIIWTGSALNIYKNDLAITRQIDFMKKSFKAKVKIFGSCWGLQVAVVAAGGKVVKNVKGREIGIARHIQTTEQGKIHPLYKGKTGPFDAVAIHLDHVELLPEGAIVLSSNEMSSVQALEIKRGNSVFWGVQYHPEFDLDYIASLMQKYKKMLVEEEICDDEASVDRLSADYRTLEQDHGREDLKNVYQIGVDVLDPCCRLQEIDNWLEYVEQKSE